MCGCVCVERLCEHFQSVLNVSSVYEIINLMPVLPLRSSMESRPTLEEIWEAFSSVNSGKAAGKNGLLPELLKCCDDDLIMYVDFFVVVWEGEEVPKEWHDALLVPVPKKGDLIKCDSWRGISLLDIMGKLFGKVL